MEILLVAEMLGLGLVSLLGWWWALGKVQDLRLELKMVKAKAEELEKGNWLARDSRLAQAHSIAMVTGKDLGLVQSELDLESDLARESARQEREKANWKVQG